MQCIFVLFSLPRAARIFRVPNLAYHDACRISSIQHPNCKTFKETGLCGSVAKPGIGLCPFGVFLNLPTLNVGYCQLRT